MKKSRTGAWLYWDERRVKTDFAIIDNGSLEIAYAQIKSLSTFRLWLFLLHRVNGYTRERKPEGYRLGEEEIRERTGLSRAGLYRSMSELQKLGLIERHKVGKTTHAYLAVSHQRDTENKSVSHQRDTSTRAGASQKPTDSDPAKKAECVSPVSLIPISQELKHTPYSPSQRDGEQLAKRDSKDLAGLSPQQLFNDSMAEFHSLLKAEESGTTFQTFQTIALEELNAATHSDNPIHTAWSSIIRLMRKKGGIDGLHHRGYPMGAERSKKVLYRWLGKVARDWTPSTDTEPAAAPEEKVFYLDTDKLQEWRMQPKCRYWMRGKAAWESEILPALRSKLGSNFGIWINPIRFLTMTSAAIGGENRDTLYLCCPNAHFVQFVTDYYLPHIVDALASIDSLEGTITLTYPGDPALDIWMDQ